MGKSVEKPTVLDKWRYEKAAREYCAGLTTENLMESTTQARQRAITLASLEVVRTARPDVQTFNELLVQYPNPEPGGRKLAGVVPDNMVVVHDEPIAAVGSFDLPFQPAGPLVVMEYVSRSNERKDFERNMTRYERDLQVPYYLLFHPDDGELTLYRLRQGRYSSVPPDAADRLAIPELELGVALLDGWVRYWFRGELVPLPGELVRERDAERRARQEAEQRAEAERRARQSAEDEIARLRAELDRLRGRPGA